MPDSAILDVTGRVRPDGVTYAPRDASPLHETRRVCRVPPTIGKLAEQSPRVMVRERRYSPSRPFVWIALFLSSYCCRSTASALPQLDLVFDPPNQLRFRPVSDGVSSIFPFIRRPFRDTGRQHRSARIFVNSRNLGQLNYAWLFPSSYLSLDMRLLCVKGDSQSTNPRALTFKAPQRQYPAGGSSGSKSRSQHR